MPELLLELFSEEIPARMQARAAEDLGRLIAEALAPLAPRDIRTFHGPRRIALAATVAERVAESRSSERGPRVGAPEQALAGFLRKHGAARGDLRQEGEYWVLEKVSAAVEAGALIAGAVPPLLRRFPWPKSMRWGGTSNFTWVRPLRRIICLLDGRTVPFDLRDGEDDGHGLASGNVTEGHRFMAPGPVEVGGLSDWLEKLRARHVIPEAAERRRLVQEGVARLAAERGLSVVDDPGLLDEVAGLVEWPVPLLGRIDDAFMDLPPEVMQVSMRVNQRYFALRGKDGAAAQFFAFAANVEARDGGAAIITGNERVLRARFSDARHFWDLDRRTRLADRVAALDGVTFHAKLGSQGDRVRRIVRLAGVIAPLVGADPDLARRGALLAKADLTSGMVGEFPELQGVMGGYYARHDGEDASVADAVRDHYAPKGPADAVPSAPVSIAVALADKLDQLAAFFGIGEKPTGSGDPYALRRAALGVIRIIRDSAAGLRFSLLHLLKVAAAHAIESIRDVIVSEYVQTKVNEVGLFRGNISVHTIEGWKAQGGEQFWDQERQRLQIPDAPEIAISVLDFIVERLRVQLRSEGARHDVLDAVFAAGADDDLVRVLARTDAVAALLAGPDGANLLTAYRRAANILRIEDRKDGPHTGAPDPALLEAPEEKALAAALDAAEPGIAERLGAEDFGGAMAAMAGLRAPLDAFFDRLIVNAEKPELRRNRLRLLHRVRNVMDRAADFSRIEG